MPFDFGKALNRERVTHTEITFADMDGSLPLDYYPGRIKETLDQLQEVANADDPEVALKKLFLNLVAQWDVTSNGEPVPLTVEGLTSIEQHLTNSRMTQIIGALSNEEVVGEANGTRLQKRLRNS